uniref:Uncharacterized protein n=1 Tax=Solibacter usitatus (strain Ellin6076) TaxID=234267 RepID=Q021L4_SOLUE
MAGTEIVMVTAKSRDAAKDALRELKRLDREGWVDITCYALVEVDANAAARVIEASTCAENLAGHLEQPLSPGDFTVVVTVEHRFAERVAAEFETRGETRRKPLQTLQSEATLRAAIEELRGKISWLAELLESEAEKAARPYGADKERIQAGIRAGRAELLAERAHLQSRLSALRTELEAHLAESAKTKKIAGAKSTEEIEREIADINEELALSILDHLDTLSAHTAELREQASHSGAGVAAAIEEQVDELDLHMRKYRADLTATLASSASLARHAMERLRSRARVRKGEREAALRQHVQQLEQRHALLKADIQQLQRKDALNQTTGFRQTWRHLRESVNVAGRGAQ